MPASDAGQLTKTTVAKWLERLAVPDDAVEALTTRLSDAFRTYAFTLANVWDVRFLAAMQETLGQALQEGLSEAEWTARAQATLDAFGDSQTLHGFTGSRANAWYADLVFRTNSQSALAQGAYAQMFSDQRRVTDPLWMYATARDERVRLTHRALDGIVFRKDDAFARLFLPPWEINCRCQAIEVSMQEYLDGGMRISDARHLTYVDADGAQRPLEPAKGWNADRAAAAMGKPMGELNQLLDRWEADRRLRASG